MSRTIQEVEADWRLALEQENAPLVQTLVLETLREHPRSILASELRYQRGMLTLTEGTGTGMERLARALGEFSEGMAAGENHGNAAEPWRSLNRTQYGVCMARRGNLEASEAELKTIVAYRPRTVVGLGALTIISEILEEGGKAREAKRYRTQRISYARGLVRDHKETESFQMMRFLLSQELLDSEYAKEGKELLRELGQLDQEILGEELFTDIQEQLEST